MSVATCIYGLKEKKKFYQESSDKCWFYWMDKGKMYVINNIKKTVGVNSSNFLSMSLHPFKQGCYTKYWFSYG